MKGPSMVTAYDDKPRSSGSFRFHKKHGKLMPKGIQVGKRHSVRMSGKVTGIRSDEFGHSLDMDLDSMANDTDADQENEPRSLTKAMKNRHMRSGRFV